ncbi:MAG: hypothetical protein M5U28_21795 [Sandaracinaceae bacterium]|nr:hypothetical protein [Sandaracinaceae bacterium]
MAGSAPRLMKFSRFSEAAAVMRSSSISPLRALALLHLLAQLLAEALLEPVEELLALHLALDLDEPRGGALLGVVVAEAGDQLRELDERLLRQARVERVDEARRGDGAELPHHLLGGVVALQAARVEVDHEPVDHGLGQLAAALRPRVGQEQERGVLRPDLPAWHALFLARGGLRRVLPAHHLDERGRHQVHEPRAGLLGELPDRRLQLRHPVDRLRRLGLRAGLHAHQGEAGVGPQVVLVLVGEEDGHDLAGALLGAGPVVDVLPRDLAARRGEAQQSGQHGYESSQHSSSSGERSAGSFEEGHGAHGHRGRSRRHPIVEDPGCQSRSVRR